MAMIQCVRKLPFFGAMAGLPSRVDRAECCDERTLLPFRVRCATRCNCGNSLAPGVADLLCRGVDLFCR